MKRFGFLITLTVLLSITWQTLSHAATFPDVTNNKELELAVDHLSDAGIIHGFPDGTFRPDDPITRGQAAKIISSALGLNVEDTPAIFYADVLPSSYYYPYIAAAANVGIFDSSAANFRPNNPMTRAEMAKVLSISFDLFTVEELPFTDTINHWSTEFVEYLFAAGITKGVSDTLYGVSEPVTRGQLAMFIVRTQDFLDVSRTTFSAEELGFEELYGDIYSLTGDYVVNVHNVDNHVHFEGIAEGTAYGFISNEPFNSELLPTDARFYQFDVVYEDGRYALYTTELNQRPSIPAVITFYDTIDHYEMFYLDGSPVDPMLIELVQNYDHFFELYVTDLYGDFILQYTNTVGEHFQQLVTINYGIVYPEVYSDNYVTGTTIFSAEQIEKVYDIYLGDFINVTAIDMNGNPIGEEALEIVFNDSTITLKPKQPVNIELIIEGRYDDYSFWLLFEQFGDGYKMIWY